MCRRRPRRSRGCLRRLPEQHFLLGRPVRSGHTGFGIDHDLVGSIPPARRSGSAQAARSSRSSPDWREPRFGDVVAIDLGEPVDRLRLQFRRIMLVAVPARIGVWREAEVGRQVDHPRLRYARQQSLDHLLRRAWGNAQKARSSPAVRQSTPSMDTSFGSTYGANCGNTAAISCPARRSAVSSAISARGWRSSKRTSSAPV